MPSVPPPSSPVADMDNGDLEAHLDAEILRIRREIAKLRSQKKMLSSALLGSARVQKHVHDRRTLRTGYDKLQERLDEAVETQRRENDVSIHRLAIGVTAFPFSDPAPEREGEPAMLGVRFDLAPTSLESISARRTTAGCGADTLQTNVGGRETSAQEGQIENTYFVMLRRFRYQGRTYLKVHHHTIPGHIDVEHYADQHLPLPEALQHNEDAGTNAGGANGTSTREESAPFEDDSGIDVTQDIQLDPNIDRTSDPTSATDPQQETETAATPSSRPSTSTSTTANIQNTNQNLHTFTNRLRDALQSWHNRSKSISHICHSLGLHGHQTPTNRGATPTTPPPIFDQHQHQYQSTASPSTHTPHHAITSLTQSTADARQLKIVWQDETLGILRLSHDGSINRAIVYGTKTKSKAMSRSSRTSQSQSQPESESELSELESDDARNIIRTRIRAQNQKQKDAKKVKETDEQPADHVRMHEVERLLMVSGDGGRVMVQDLVGRLRVIGERVFSA
ncbi:hypothetical protein LTR70_000408 [Exophiala xenobiotica]|uniref:Uncharacterized protein n=1 Tax=Lithohypha guttulata TaxID=1690604 RepID=A0ABR0KPS6_9EURO|nr:hypothetical protein LTR24_000109 [Lithohypha guttulata]KAK5330578.1 hypothetical protein LTR70_000408 [Exophiala xenobiotica]